MIWLWFVFGFYVCGVFWLFALAWCLRVVLLLDCFYLLLVMFDLHVLLLLFWL